MLINRRMSATGVIISTICKPELNETIIYAVWDKGAVLNKYPSFSLPTILAINSDKHRIELMR
jgi:hypothetical protein